MASTQPDGAIRVVASFSDASAARRAESALLASGFGAASIVVAGASPAVAAALPQREERFLGRLVLIVLACSMVGTLVGVVMGLTFNALGIGPSGAGGVGIQIASWAIFAHLIAGMWAGYALLTRVESRDPVVRTHDGRAVVSVWCADEGGRGRAEGALRAAGAGAVAAYDGAGRRIVAVG